MNGERRGYHRERPKGEGKRKGERGEMNRGGGGSGGDAEEREATVVMKRREVRIVWTRLIYRDDDGDKRVKYLARLNWTPNFH